MTSQGNRAMSATKVTAHETKAKQAEIFRRAAAGERILVTNNDKPQVEIRQVMPTQERIHEAIDALTVLHQKQLVYTKGGSEQALKKISI